MRSDPTLRRWFKKINERYFDNQVADNVCVRYATDDEVDKSENDRCFGWCEFAEDGRNRFVIVLSRKHNELLTGRLSTLAHEMCHCMTDCKDSHGAAFERWRQYISDKGIFKKSALVKGLTIF
jgi:hypothetical protein